MREIVAVDIGATNARFACATFEDGLPVLGPIRKYRVADFETFNDCWETYVRDEAEALPNCVVIGLASPIVGEEIKLTNGTWTFRPKTIAEELGLESVKLVNDFAAVAHAIASLSLDQMEPLFGPDVALPRNGTVAVLGPGTGLGVAILVFNNGNPQIIPTEAGHIDFAPADQIEARIARFLKTLLKVEHISAERIVSGPGLNYLYQALADIGEKEAPALTDAEVWQQALDGTNPLARAALERFCLVYGSVAGNIALAQGAKTVVLAGKLTERLHDFMIKSSGFHPRFVAKGRFENYMKAISIRLALPDEVGLFGAAAAAFREDHSWR
ncbi:MAG: glucokinase [Sphingobium sp.]|nr:glucokinase [Sphingobium sp.]